MRARRNPGGDELTEFGLRAWRRPTTFARVPGPSHQIVRGHVVLDPRQVVTAISCGILELLANLSKRLALPRHGGWGEPPARMARNTPYRRPQCRDVGGPVTRLARQRGHALAICAALHQGDVRMQIVALGRPRFDRMAVQAAWTLDDLASLPEQRYRARPFVGDIGERCRRLELSAAVHDVGRSDLTRAPDQRNDRRGNTEKGGLHQLLPIDGLRATARAVP